MQFTCPLCRVVWTPDHLQRYSCRWRPVVCRFTCDVCGKTQEGKPKACERCSLNVCAFCDADQAGVGHLEAEHGNEIRRRARR